jgi:hypothetical protein
MHGGGNMVRAVVILGFISFMAYMPLYAFDHLVMPQLTGLKTTYEHADDTAARITNSSSQTMKITP